MFRFILHNGEIREASDKLLSPGQLGLLSGWGVFSTLRVAQGVPFAFERHWARMQRDAEALHVPFPADAQEIRGQLLRLIQANEISHATLRIAVVRNRGGLWEGPGNTRDFDVIAFLAEIKHWHREVKLGLQARARYSAGPFSGAKMLSWAPNLVWLEQAHQRGFDEVLLLNERGEVSECTSANIFAAFGNEVRTPPLDSGCLPGVTREILLEQIRVPGVSVIEKTLYPADLEAADEVFITSTTRDLLPVVAVEGLNVRRIDSDRAALEQAFGEYIESYVAQHGPAPAAR